MIGVSSRGRPAGKRCGKILVTNTISKRNNLYE